ncbi:hypothetical protein ACTL6P_17780 [Endozoicomonas acroporae]|uniref:hypothetical protein n=1 Tax=Endozoicomonas acroporae TaxID=1701104 RepID=UPI000C75B0EE|nr:hypothetical protein [Endozoicomonas acroporae]
MSKPMNEKSRKSLEKLLGFAAQIAEKDWTEYCDRGGLNLKLIGKDAGITRSVLYHNDHVKNALLDIAKPLLEKGVIEKLPYESKQEVKADSSFIRERKSQEINKLKEENRRLANKVADLQAEVKSHREKLKRFELQERILTTTGRLPR